MAKKPQPGWYVWGWFMVLAGVERLLIEFIRRNPVVFLGLRTTQWESIVSVVIGVAIILYVRGREPVEASLVAAGSGSRRADRGAGRAGPSGAARLRRQGRLGRQGVPRQEPARRGKSARGERRSTSAGGRRAGERRLPGARARRARGASAQACAGHRHQQQGTGRVFEDAAHDTVE